MGPDDMSVTVVVCPERTCGRSARRHGLAASQQLPSTWGRQFDVRHIQGRARGHGHAIWRVRGVLWTRRLVTGAVTSHGAGDMAGAVFPADGPLLRVQTTCLGDQTHRHTSVEDVWRWGATPPLGGVPAVSARLGVVSLEFGVPGDMPEGTNMSFDMFNASQGQ